MAFFDDLKDKTIDIAQAGVAKSKQLMQLAKLNMANAGEEDTIKKAYLEIGKLYYAERGMAPEAAAALIQGEEGTQVELRWLRDGRVRSAVLTRTKVVVPSTSTTLVDGHIGYLDCTTIADDTYGHIQEGIAASTETAVGTWASSSSRS